MKQNVNNVKCPQSPHSLQFLAINVLPDKQVFIAYYNAVKCAVCDWKQNNYILYLVCTAH